MSFHFDTIFLQCLQCYTSLKYNCQSKVTTQMRLVCLMTISNQGPWTLELCADDNHAHGLMNKHPIVVVIKHGHSLFLFFLSLCGGDGNGFPRLLLALAHQARMLLSLVNVGLPNGYSTLAIDPHGATKSRSSSLSSQFPKEPSIIAFGAAFDASHDQHEIAHHMIESSPQTHPFCVAYFQHTCPRMYTSIQWTESRRRLVNPNLMSFHMSQASQTEKYLAWCFDGKPIGRLPLGGLHLLWY